MIDTEGRGIERAMRQALERAGLEPGEVTAVWSAAAGHRIADAAEAAAISRVFGDGATVHSPKLRLGEPIGAGASLNAALALLAWEHGAPRGPALVNGLSLGGTNFSLVLAPVDDGGAGAAA